MADSAIQGRDFTSVRFYRRRLLLAAVASVLLHLMFAGGLVATRLGILTHTAPDSEAGKNVFDPKPAADFPLDVSKASSGKPIHEKPLDVQLKSNSAQTAAKTEPTLKQDRSVSPQESSEPAESTAASSMALPRTAAQRDAALEKAAALARQKSEGPKTTSASADTSAITPAADTQSTPAVKPATAQALPRTAESVSAATAAPKEVALVTQTAPRLDVPTIKSVRPQSANTLAAADRAPARKDLAVPANPTLATADTISSKPVKPLAEQVPVVKLKPQQRLEPDQQSQRRSKLATTAKTSPASETVEIADPTTAAATSDLQSLAQATLAQTRRAENQTASQSSDRSVAMSVPKTVGRQKVSSPNNSAAPVEISTGGAAAAAKATADASATASSAPAPATRGVNKAPAAGGAKVLRGQTAVGNEAEPAESTSGPTSAVGPQLARRPTSRPAAVEDVAVGDPSGQSAGAPGRTFNAVNEAASSAQATSTAESLPNSQALASSSDGSPSTIAAASSALKPSSRVPPRAQPRERLTLATKANSNPATDTAEVADPTATASTGDVQSLASTTLAQTRRAENQTASANSDRGATIASPQTVDRQAVSSQNTVPVNATPVEISGSGAAAAATATASAGVSAAPQPATRVAKTAPTAGGATVLREPTAVGSEAEASESMVEATAAGAASGPQLTGRSASRSAAADGVPVGDPSGESTAAAPGRTFNAASAAASSDQSTSTADTLSNSPATTSSGDGTPSGVAPASATVKPGSRLARSAQPSIRLSISAESAFGASGPSAEADEELSREAIAGNSGTQPGLTLGNSRRGVEAPATVVESIALSRVAIVVLPVEGRAREIAKPFEKRDQKKRVLSDVDATVERGLDFLVRAQQPDGRWCLEKFPGAGKNELPKLQSDTAATGLALLSFLGAGYDHFDGKHRDTVRRGLEFLLSVQKPDGDLFVPSDKLSNSCAWLYSHGIATMALCEAVGMTGDPLVRPAAEKACGFIATSQHPELGGWRYTPRSDADLSVSGWMLVALRSGQLAGISIDPQVMDRVRKLLDTSTAPNAAATSSGTPGSIVYLYNARKPDQRPSQSSSLCMVALGTLMRLHTGWSKTDPRVIESGRTLSVALPSFGTKDQKARDCYLWYYVSQVLVHTGGDTWQKWYGTLYEQLSATQESTGVKAGSWDPLGATPDRWGLFGGRLYVTTLHLLTLEVPYRHLPTYSLSDGEPAKGQ